jgi:hypothetical protein
LLSAITFVENALQVGDAQRVGNRVRRAECLRPGGQREPQPIVLAGKRFCLVQILDSAEFLVAAFLEVDIELLQTRPAPSADRATRIPAQHVRRRIGTPPNDEGHKRDGYAMAAGVAAQPSLIGLMQQFAQRRYGGRRRPRSYWRRIVVGITSASHVPS